MLSLFFVVVFNPFFNFLTPPPFFFFFFFFFFFDGGGGFMVVVLLKKKKKSLKIYPCYLFLNMNILASLSSANAPVPLIHPQPPTAPPPPPVPPSELRYFCEINQNKRAKETMKPVNQPQQQKETAKTGNTIKLRNQYTEAEFNAH